MAASPPSKKTKIKEDSSASLKQIFSGYHGYIVEHGVGKVRCNILKRQLENRGGSVENELSSNTTHIFVSKDLRKERLLKILKKNEVDDRLQILSVDWISACLVQGELVKEDAFFMYHKEKVVESENLVKKGNEVKNLKESSTVANTVKDMGSKENVEKEMQVMKEDSGISTEEDDMEKNSSAIKSNYKSFICARPSTSKGENFNSHITDKLQILLDEYTNTQDRWRAFGYKKAIASISKYHKPLETYEEVLKLPAVGERLAKKVWEIIETGHLKRLDHIDPKVETLKLFSGVWGAGPKTAEQWVARGFKCLEDLPEDELTFQQKIGIKHYADINEKMPRGEVAEFEKLIRNHAVELLPGVLLVVCGSYRRGRSFCGDIDILISHPDGKSHQGFLYTLLNKLKEVELITDDLITVENDAQKKYMGMCKLPGEHSKFRRIDFIAAPYSEWPCALLHFTGSAHLNRSMRLLAKKKNMSLSEHALRKNVIRGQTGEKINKGELVPVSCEADIFEYLQLDYLEPTDRDW